MGRKYYTSEEKPAAVKLYIKYDFSPSAVIYELGYPSRNRLYSWYKEYKETGKFTIKGNHTKYTAEQRKAAVQYYLEHGRTAPSGAFLLVTIQLSAFLLTLLPNSRTPKRSLNHNLSAFPTG
jgi:transposase-like protein